AAERRYFRAGVFPNVSSSGNWSDVGHYTQMVWRGTTSVGCALHQSPRWDFLICRYAPSGNVVGQRVP
ncbi:MAG TPA: CAP domain-containing protein, partial [Allosphingosinicella sp.]|nr:CAP domain-containing protein [Allosphingosinicella sp.]